MTTRSLRWRLRHWSLFIAGTTLLTSGCATQPTFIPGSGSVFGTIDDQQGNTYKITQLADNSVNVVAGGVEGDLSFAFDPDGKLMNLAAPDGSNINFNHQTIGMVAVSGIGVFEGQQFPFGFSFSFGNQGGSKVLNRSQSTGDPFLVCAIIDSFCDGLEQLIVELLPPLIDAFINENLPALIAEFNKQSFIPIPEGVVTQFPTGIEPVDDFIRAEAMKRIDPLLAQARNFCAQWQLLRLLEISACDA